jgi:hypothetical protein
MKIPHMNKHHIIGVLAALALVVGVSVVRDVKAIGNNYNNYNLDGGGESYDIQDVQIPEISPPQGADVEVTVATNGNGVSTSYQFNVQVNADLWYAWNRWLSTLYPSSDTATQGWVRAVTNPNVTIGYDIGVYDATSGDRIPEGGTVTVGQQIKLTFGPYIPDNIYWFGTGYSMDSPFGEWRAGATAPPRVSNQVTCTTKDYVVKYRLGEGYNLDFGVYIPLVVNPPARAIANIPSNLSCASLNINPDTSATMTCTVLSAGSFAPTFHFDATSGKFYYRYYDFRDMGGYGGPGCYGNNIPLAPVSSNGNWDSVTSIRAPYILSVPIKDISYPLTAGTPSNPPTTPTVTEGGISCPTTATVPAGQSIVFTATATDPDGDTLRYGFDWLNSGLVNEWVPSSGYVTSGVSQSVVHSWNSGGLYHVKVKAQDSHGASSGWSQSCDITVTGTVGQCADGLDNDADGFIDCADRGCHVDGNAGNGASCDPSAKENPQCSDSADNDGDAKADTLDPGCHTDANATNAASYNPGDTSEVNTQCSDGIDNDSNGKTDYKADGTGDTGCTSLSDTDESNNAQLSLALAASASVVQYGSVATLSWSATNIQSGTCRITGTNGSDYNFDSGTLAGTSGTVTTTGKPLTSQVTFTLSCANLSGITVNTTAVVRVTPRTGEF